MTTASSRNTETNPSPSSDGSTTIDGRTFELGQLVTTHPVWLKDRTERPRRGPIVRTGPLFSRVQIDGVPQTFWNFELEAVLP